MNRLKDLNVGDKVIDHKGIIFTVAHHKYYSNDTSVLISNHIDRLPFDEAECDFVDKENKSDVMVQRHGYNRYDLSNIRQYLNAEGKDWYKKTHKFDTINPILSNKPGFLSNLSREFKMNIVPVNIKTLKNIKDGSNLYSTKDKVFLASLEQVGLADEMLQQELEEKNGSFDLFNSDENRIYINIDNPYNVTWFLRTCVRIGNKRDDRCYLHVVDHDGTLTSRQSDDKNYIRVCINLNNNIAVSNRKTDEGYYLLFKSVLR